MSNKRKVTSQFRSLGDLKSVGKATLLDLRKLGVTTVEQLVGRSAQDLYLKLCKMDGIRHDICTQDVFSAAIAQAEDPRLLSEKSNWWYWSNLRKGVDEKKKRS